MNLGNKRGYIAFGLDDLSFHRHRVFFKLISFLIVSSSEAYAFDITMECSGVLYQYDSSLFQSDEIKIRREGAWKDWCDGSLNIIDSSARCISEDTEMVKFPIVTNNSLDEDLLKDYLVAYCSCGGRFRFDDAKHSIRMGEKEYSNCLKKFDVDKYTVFLSGLDLIDSGLSLNELFVDLQICPKVHAGSIELEGLVENYPKLLEKNLSIYVRETDTEANVIKHIDFLSLKIYTEYQTIAEPLRRKRGYQAVCSLVEK